jgi:malonate transporter MadL subunit
MIIYGVALLALSCLGGLVIGDALGALLGVKANVGGVGFAMLLLIYLTDGLARRDQFQSLSAAGVLFWSGMYIPVVIAMAAQQNVLGAIKGGPLAILAGTSGVVLSFALVPLIARMGRPPPNPDAANTAGREGA